MLCVVSPEVCKVQEQPGFEFGNKPHGSNLRRAITFAGSNPANTLTLRRTRCGNLSRLGFGRASAAPHENAKRCQADPPAAPVSCEFSGDRAAVAAPGSAATLSTGHLLGADFLNSSNNFHELCSRFQARIRRSSSPSDVTTHAFWSEPRAKLFIDATPGMFP